MDIQAVIYEDGSMYDYTVWEGDFNEGTESYIPMNAPDYLTSASLRSPTKTVLMKPYRSGNIDWSFEEKAKKYAASIIPTADMKSASASVITDKPLCH